MSITLFKLRNPDCKTVEFEVERKATGKGRKDGVVENARFKHHAVRGNFNGICSHTEKFSVHFKCYEFS